METLQDRELSTLAFQARVLAEAADPKNPLLERANFLGITAKGLQEFICVRLGSLTSRVRKGEGEAIRPSGLGVSQTLEKAWNLTDRITMRMDRILHEQILPSLRQEGVRILQADDVMPVQMAALSAVFSRDLMPLLEIVVLDEEHPLPVLPSGLSNLAVLLEGDKPDTEQIAIVQMPASLPGLVRLVGNGQWLSLEDAVRVNLHLIFGERKIKACHAFKVLRAANAACKSSETDIRRAVQDCLNKRAKGRILRVVCAPEMSGLMEEALCRALKVDRGIAVRCGLTVDHIRLVRALMNLPEMEQLRYTPYQGQTADVLTGDLFAAIRAQDQLLCHPYDSFAPVMALLSQAAEDSCVQCIHMTLYRISEQSGILEAMKRAAQRGIQVHVCVEPRARMDEERNLQLIQVLEKAGCRVYTGVGGVKVHGKAMLIVRSEEGKLRRYVHLGTGNYNETTAAQYTDFGLLTADEAFAADAERFFECLEGRREQPDLQTLTSSPQGMRQELLRLIRREMEKAVRGEPCGVTCMMNALTDVELIGTLNEAARCGVAVDLTVRGACCLIPGENITVRSVVGRYLEHGRAFAFGAPGQEEVFIASADWMKRSLNRRLELLIPVRDSRCVRKLLYCMRVRREKDARVWNLDGTEYALQETEQDVQEKLMRQAQVRWSDV